VVDVNIEGTVREEILSRLVIPVPRELRVCRGRGRKERLEARAAMARVTTRVLQSFG